MELLGKTSVDLHFISAATASVRTHVQLPHGTISRVQPPGPILTAMRLPSMPQGQKHGAKIVLRGEAGCSDPTVQPGDVVFVLEQKEHRFFKRINQVGF